MKEVLPGIFQMPLTLSGFSPNTVNTYLIRDRNGYVMIDTGWDTPPAIQSLENQLAEIGAGMTDIQRVIITHCHIDHFGMIPRLKNNYHAQIYLHQNELDLIKTRFTGGDNFLPMTDKFLQSHGVPSSELAPPEFQIPVALDLVSTPPDILLSGGEEITIGDYTLEVINTPGHTPGHIALFEPGKRFLFSGDVLLPTIATNAAMHIQQMSFPIQQYFKSLHALTTLDIDLVLPGHEYVFTDHRQRIEGLIKHVQDKDTEIRNTFTNEAPKTAYAVASEIFQRQTKPFWSKMTGWNKRFALLQTIAHLESLRFNHILSQEYINGTIYFRLIK